MEKHNINLITYGSRIDTDVNTMADGMIELLDDLCDFALSRVFNSASKLEKKLDLRDLPSLEIAKFRFTWLISLSELMFYSMSEQAKLEHLKNRFYQLVKIDANERSLEIFVDGAISNVKSLINSDRDFVDNEILSFPASNQAEGDPRNHGLGPRLWQLIQEPDEMDRKLNV